MTTISPVEYHAFKKRVKKALIGTVVFGIGFIFLIKASNHITGNQDQSPKSIDLGLVIFLICSITVIVGIVMLSQIWVLDSVIIDEEKKKIKILTRKFDTLIDKGEFDIDDDLKIKIFPKKKSSSKSSHTLSIKYKKKRVFSQNNSSFAGSAIWNYDLFYHISSEVERIKKT